MMLDGTLALRCIKPGPDRGLLASILICHCEAICAEAISVKVGIRLLRRFAPRNVMSRVIASVRRQLAAAAKQSTC